MGRLVYFVVFLSMLPFYVYGTPIYTYVDENGIRHFTNIRPINKNYKVFFYGKEDVDMAGKGQEMPTYDELIWKFSRMHNVDPHLVKAIIKVESNFNPFAVSKKGAQGLMQIMPETARLVDVKNPFDPEENIAGGTKYLRYLFDFFQNNLDLILAAYNAGPLRVLEYGSVPPFEETKTYVKKVISHYRAFKGR